MRLNFFVNLKFLSLFGFLFLFFGVLFAQYFYYDSGTSTYPYQQGCSEDLAIRINTQGTGAMAGIFDLILDPTKISYTTTSDTAILRTNLFAASSETFLNWTAGPFWKSGSNSTILNIDRYNSVTPYNGTTGLYGIVKFVPLYNASPFNGSFSIGFTPAANGCDSNATIETTLSLGGCDIINLTQQNSRLTGTYSFLQEPCVADTNAPSINNIFPVNSSDKQTRLSGVSLSLNEAAGVTSLSNVPYVWTGGHTIWTGNPGGAISNQYGINPDTLNLTISGNGNYKLFTGSSLGVSLVGTGKTWQDDYKNYAVVIDQAQLFDYGIEKTITIKADVADRKGLSSAQATVTFNSPVSPSSLGTFTPSNGAIFVNLGAPINLGIQDNWAGVDSGSIRVTLQGINGTSYGPYIFSGSDLNLSGVASNANQPNYYLSISNHAVFPTSGTIRVVVYAEDMENNVDNISDYTFTTRPACSELQCCDDIYTQIGNGTSTIYSYTDLYVNYASGIVPTFTNGGSTGYLDCRESYYGISVFSGDGNTGTFLDQFTGTELVFSGTNIKAILTGNSGNVILLIRLGKFIIKVYPSSRVTTLDNIGRILFYNQAKNIVYSGSINTNSLGTGDFLDGLNNIQAGTYYVVYKGQSHLSSYISGFVVVQNSGLMLLDFTTGTNLYGVQNVDSQTDNGSKYQSAGDLKNSQSVYDFKINGNDISILVASGLSDTGIPLLDPRNLNGDTALNASDISIVGTNFAKEDASFFGGMSAFLTGY